MILIIFIWTVFTIIEIPGNVWFAGIDETFIAGWSIFTDDYLNIISSFLQILIGASLSIVFGVLIGVWIGYKSKIYNSLKPSIDFWRSIPPVIIIPILVNLDPSENEILWRVLLVMFGCVPIFTMLIADAVIESSEKKLLVFKGLNTSFKFKFKNVIFYEILPIIFSGTRTVISFAVIIVIVSEMVYPPNDYGIGKQVFDHETAYEMQYVYAYTIIVGFIGIFMNYIVRYIEKKKVWWTEKK